MRYSQYFPKIVLWEIRFFASDTVTKKTEKNVQFEQKKPYFSKGMHWENIDDIELDLSALTQNSVYFA